MATVDGGAFWLGQASGTAVDLLAVEFVDSEHGWAVGMDGTLIHSSDGGETWSRENVSTGNGFHALDVLDPLTAFAAGDMGIILGFKGQLKSGFGLGVWALGVVIALMAALLWGLGWQRRSIRRGQVWKPNLKLSDSWKTGWRTKA